MSYDDYPDWTSRSEGEPHDRLTRIAGAMEEVLNTHPERGGDERCMVFLQSSEWGQGAVMAVGYATELDAIMDVMRHVQAMMISSGITTEDLAEELERRRVDSGED